MNINNENTSNPLLNQGVQVNKAQDVKQADDGKEGDSSTQDQVSISEEAKALLKSESATLRVGGGGGVRPE